MPKTKQSRAQRLLSALKPNTNKKRLIMFVVLFAFIGGGYMAYKSFAATKTYDFLLSQGLATNPPFVVKKLGSVSVVKETSGQKKNIDVVKVTGSASGWSYVGALKRIEDQLPQDDKPGYFQKGNYRVCALVKAEATDARFILAMIHENSRGGDPFQTGGLTASTSEYTKVCENIPTADYAWPTVIVGRGSVRVSTISITPLGAASSTFMMNVDNGMLAGRDGAIVETEKIGTKKGLKVIRVTDKLNSSATLKSDSTASENLRSFMEQNVGKQLRLCGYVAPGRALSVQAYAPAATGWEFIPVQPLNDKQYQYVCTNYSTVQSLSKGYSIPEFRIASPTTGISLYVWGLVLETR